MGVPTIPTVLGLALSAAGTGLSISAARDTQRRMNEVVRRQVEEAEGFQQQATPEFQKSLGASGSRAAVQALAEGEQQALEGYRQVQDLPAVAAPSSILGNSLVNIRNQGRIAQQNQAQAALQGYGNMAIQQYLAQQQAQQNLGVISNLASSRAAITPYLLQGEKVRGESLASVGSLLGSAGALAGVYGGLLPYLQPQQPAPQKPPSGVAS